VDGPDIDQLFLRGVSKAAPRKTENAERDQNHTCDPHGDLGSQRLLDLASLLLNVAEDLFRLSFCRSNRVIGKLADLFNDGSLHFVNGTLDLIFCAFVHFDYSFAAMRGLLNPGTVEQSGRRPAESPHRAARPPAEHKPMTAVAAFRLAA
jgi:hypothetical protein